MIFSETVLYCFFIVVFNAVVLAFYHFRVDPNKDIERHYFRTNKTHYAVFKLAYFTIMVSFVMSVRYLLYEGFTVMSSRRS